MTRGMICGMHDGRSMMRIEMREVALVGENPASQRLRTSARPSDRSPVLRSLLPLIIPTPHFSLGFHSSELTLITPMVIAP